MVDAVILAGGREDELEEGSNTHYKALLKIGDQTMLEYVLEAVEGSGHLERTATVGPREQLLPLVEGRVDYIVDDNNTMIDNICRGVEKLQPQGRVFVITSDIPLVTAEAIDDFLDRCEKRQGDIFYPVISQESNTLRYPQVERTYARLKDGTYTGGNMILINPEVLISCRGLLEKVVAARKNPVKLSRLLGVRFVIKFFFGRLSLAEIEARITEVIGYRGVAVISPYPEVGIDVDKPSDLDLVKTCLL